MNFSNFTTKSQEVVQHAIDLAQANNQPIRLGEAATLFSTAGEDSHGNALPAQVNRGVFVRNGQDVTAAVVRMAGGVP